MRMTAPIVVLTLASLNVANGQDQIRVAQYPYGHEPELAWRVTILTDGNWLHEESAVPLKVSTLVDVGDVRWVPATKQSSGRVSQKKLTALFSSLRDLKLETLTRRYSAQHTFLHPTERTQVVPAEGDPYLIPAESTRVVTHGDTYVIEVVLDGLSVESSVYAPFVALRYENPEHPDRDQIVKLVTAWYEVFRATGPVRSIEAKLYRPYLELSGPSNSDLNLPATPLAWARVAPRSARS